jgi:hypothetical protein
MVLETSWWKMEWHRYSLFLQQGDFHFCEIFIPLFQAHHWLLNKENIRSLHKLSLAHNHIYVAPGTSGTTSESRIECRILLYLLFLLFYNIVPRVLRSGIHVNKLLVCIYLLTRHQIIHKYIVRRKHIRIVLVLHAIACKKYFNNPSHIFEWCKH